MEQKRPIDTAGRLWDYYFKVRLPYLQSRSIEDIRKYGVVLTGVKEIDSDIHNQWHTTYLTIAQMAEYYKEGVPIKVCLEADVKTIYDYISDHILAWKSRLERGINIGDAPIDDLILLDQFANTVYAHAKYQFTQDTVDSLFVRHLDSLQRVNANNFFKGGGIQHLNQPQEQDGITRINPIEEQLPERDSLEEFFKNRLINIRRF